MRSVVFLALVTTTLVACSALTSWDDVRLDAENPNLIEAGGSDAAREGSAIEGGPKFGDAGPNSGETFDASGCTCESTLGLLPQLQCETETEKVLAQCDEKCVTLAEPTAGSAAGAACTCVPGRRYCAGHDNAIASNDPNGDGKTTTLWVCGADGVTLTLAQTCTKTCVVVDAGFGGADGTGDDVCP